MRRYSVKELEKKTAALSKSGKVIGLTHGAFDLLHPGHLELLERAKEQCDFLIVGVQSDKDIKSYKGTNRPIHSEDFRVRMVSSVRHVDAVFLLNKGLGDGSYVALYEKLRVNKAFVGSSFGFMQNIKKREKRLGFDLVIIKQNMTSTTGIINKILEKHT